MDLAGRVAIVTGGGTGIGSSVAYAMSKGALGTLTKCMARVLAEEMQKIGAWNPIGGMA